MFFWFFCWFFLVGAEVKVTSKLHLQGEGGEGESKVASSGAHDICLGNGRSTGSLTAAAIHYFLKISFFVGGQNLLNLEFCFSYQGISSDKWAILYPYWTLLYQARVEDSASAPNTLRKGKSQTASPIIPASLPRHYCLKGTAPRPCAKIRGPSPYRLTRSSPFPITPPSFPSPPVQGSKGLAWDRQAWANAPPHFTTQAWGPKNKPP
jgi:hypothetical protein